MNYIYNKLDKCKYEINSWNNNLIEMKLFLSFLMVRVDKSTGHYLGYNTGWTQHTGDDDLVIQGGIYKGVEYLDTIQYKHKLDNFYNNYVNPFQIFDILTTEGRLYFRDYYNDDINKLVEDNRVAYDRKLKELSTLDTEYDNIKLVFTPYN